MSRKGKAAGVLALTVLYIGPVSGAEPLRLQQNHDVMGSTFSVILYGADPDRLEKAATAAFDEADRIDGLLSNYKANSEWSRINRGGAQGPVRATGEMFALLS